MNQNVLLFGLALVEQLLEMRPLLFVLAQNAPALRRAFQACFEFRERKGFVQKIECARPKSCDGCRGIGESGQEDRNDRGIDRSEERRVGKECRARGGGWKYKKE